MTRSRSAPPSPPAQERAARAAPRKAPEERASRQVPRKRTAARGFRGEPWGSGTRAATWCNMRYAVCSSTGVKAPGEVREESGMYLIVDEVL